MRAIDRSRSSYDVKIISRGAVYEADILIMTAAAIAIPHAITDPDNHPAFTAMGRARGNFAGYALPASIFSGRLPPAVARPVRRSACRDQFATGQWARVDRQ